MPLPILTAESGKLFKRQIIAALEYLDGLASALGGLTATVTELNILDGVTATTAELNILDGVTAATAELNYTDGVTSPIQTQIDALGPQLQTAIAASGQTEIDFTGIPTWVNRVTVTGFGISTSGTSNYILRIGDGAVVATGYLGAITTIAGATPTTNNPTTGATLLLSPTAASVFRFSATIQRASGNTWVISGSGSLSNTATTSSFTSEVTLTGDLDRVRLTAVNGTDTFDAGSVNISWE